MGNKKEKYTSARPVSFCRREKTIGRKHIDDAIICDLDLLKSVSGLDKYLDKAKAVNILQVSTGCKFIKPRGIQLLEPFTLFPIKNVRIRRPIPIKYKIFGVAVNSLLSISIINVAITMQTKK
jgi:hypothetical protein